MRAWSIVALCAALAVMSLTAGATWSGPVKGASSPGKVQVPSAEGGSPGESAITVPFRANERAAVIIRGDHNPVADLEIVIFEAGGNGQPVAHGKGSKDLVAAVWTPLRTGEYRILFRNSAPFSKSNPYNECYVAFK